MNEEKKARYETGGGNYHSMAYCYFSSLYSNHEILVLFSLIKCNKL